jgi:putative oxidoreductase
MKIARLATRLLIGGLFVGHGTQKLFGAFDGPGVDGTEAMMAKLKMHPPRVSAYAAGLSETAGGAMFAMGSATPLAGAALIGTMITAIRKVHAPNGPWVTKGGYEYNAVLIAAITAIVEDEYGVPAALAALGLGAVASAITIELSNAELSDAELSKPELSEPAPAYPVDAIAAQGETGTVTPDVVRAESSRTA